MQRMITSLGLAAVPATSLTGVAVAAVTSSPADRWAREIMEYASKQDRGTCPSPVSVRSARSKLPTGTRLFVLMSAGLD